MGRWAVMAEEHWRRYLPRAHAQLTSREAFFAGLEEEAQNQLDDIFDHLVSLEPPGETMADRLARYQRARQTAEEIVIHEVILIAPESDQAEVAAPQEDPGAPDGTSSGGPTQGHSTVMESQNQFSMYAQIVRGVPKEKSRFVTNEESSRLWDSINAEVEQIKAANPGVIFDIPNEMP